jgi:hypothetical protein
MKTGLFASSHLIVVALLTLVINTASGQILFTDDFNLGASPLWGNQRGNWTDTGGTYNAQQYLTKPGSYSGLPIILEDFTVEVDINGVGDGGIYLRSDESGSNGVVLITGGNGFYNGDPGSGRSLYWHVATNGSLSPIQNEVQNVFTNPGVQNTHIRVEVVGNIYSAYVDYSPTPTTVLTNSIFPTGRVGLFDNLPSLAQQAFDNFSLEGLPIISMFPAVEIDWFAYSGVSYQVQWVTNMISTNWTNLGTPVFGTGTNISVFDSTRGYEKRFYRVESVQ